MSERAEAEEMSAADIDGRFIPRPRPNVTVVVLDGEAVVLAEGAGSAYYLDELATLVWNTLDGEATIDELAEDFADVFGAELEVVRSDIVVLTQNIGRAGLLEGIAYEPPPEPTFAWPTGVDLGEPIPPFKLPDADGAEVAAADLRGRSVLLDQLEPPVRILHDDRARARRAAARAPRARCGSGVHHAGRRGGEPTAA